MNHRLGILALPGLLLSAATLSGQITFVLGIPGTNEVNVNAAYTQDFDAIGASTTFTDNTTLAGWYANKTTMALTAGGGSSTGVMYNYGTSSGDPERSIGGQPNTTSSIVLGLRLINATGLSITSMDIDYVVEQWRRDTSPNSQVVLDYQIFSSGTGSIGAAGTWTQLATVTPDVTGTGGAINGNNNQFAQGASPASLGWADGDELWLRWSFIKTGGSNIHMAIDDLTITVVPEPATVAALAGLLALGLVIWRRRR